MRVINKILEILQLFGVSGNTPSRQIFAIFIWQMVGRIDLDLVQHQFQLLDLLGNFVLTITVNEEWNIGRLFRHKLHDKTSVRD